MTAPTVRAEETTARRGQWVRAADLAELQAAGRLVATVEGRVIALFADGERVFAVDNRCPHMGFPLHRGSVCDGILTCHWHHARFDLATGGTFDPWADDVVVYPVRMRDGAVWVSLAARKEPRDHHLRRLRDGLERDLPLVLAKAAIALIDQGVAPAEMLRIGLDFGSRHREAGWGQGLTILTCMANLLPHLAPDDAPRALYHGLAAVARDCAGESPRFPLRPLPGRAPEPPTLAQWFREFIERRDAEGAERCVVSAVRSGVGRREMAEMLLTAATDHRYLQTGHVLDFTNKAFEALDVTDWVPAEPVLASLATAYAEAERMEESNAWRRPIDLIAIEERAFQPLPERLVSRRVEKTASVGEGNVLGVLLGDDPERISRALLEAHAAGMRSEDLAGAVVHAAALRIVRFHTSNEFGDWDRALHTFSFANAVHQALRRVGDSPALLRGVFDAAMSIYLDRFLNVPEARIPAIDPPGDPADLLGELPGLFDRRQRTEEARALVTGYLAAGGEPSRLLAVLGAALLREDRDFHTIQMVEGAFRQDTLRPGSRAGADALVAAARYLAAHAPTVRSQEQTYRIAWRLHRGERLYEDA